MDAGGWMNSRDLPAPDERRATNMSRKNQDLHGNAPDKSSVALLLIDVINDLEFPEGDQLLQQAIPMAHAILQLKQRAVAAKIPVIYVNDNFGKWRSDFYAQVKHCLEDGVRGAELVQLLKPQAEEYFVLKPKHSGFFSTSLELLLTYLEVRKVILTGVTANSCVLFTANDAYMRDLDLLVPADCVAAFNEEDRHYALEQMRTILKADIRPSTELDLESLAQKLH